MLHQSDNNVDVNTFLTFILVLLVSYIIWSYYFSVRINIPGPTPWPIVGNIPNLLGVINVGKRFLEFQKQYGDMVLLGCMGDIEIRRKNKSKDQIFLI
jgi:hypothetical protein